MLANRPSTSADCSGVSLDLPSCGLAFSAPGGSVSAGSAKTLAGASEAAAATAAAWRANWRREIRFAAGSASDSDDSFGSLSSEFEADEERSLRAVPRARITREKLGPAGLWPG